VQVVQDPPRVGRLAVGPPLLRSDARAALRPRGLEARARERVDALVLPALRGVRLKALGEALLVQPTEPVLNRPARHPGHREPPDLRREQEAQTARARGALGAEVGRRRTEDRVLGVVWVPDAVAVGVDPEARPGGGLELHPADSPGTGDGEVLAEARLDLVDRREDRG
jgi:hypothetical protein